MTFGVTYMVELVNYRAEAIRNILKANLSDDVTEKAINGIVRELKNGLNDDYTNSSFIGTVNLFYWAETPEGDTFWRTVNEACKKAKYNTENRRNVLAF